MLNPPLDLTLEDVYRDLPAELENQYCKGITLHPFSPAVFQHIKQHWAGHPNRKVAWDWDYWYQSFRRSPNRFELVMLVNGDLCGLCLGRRNLDPPHGQPPRIELHYIEGDPNGHALKGDTVALAADIAANYGQAIGAKELRIIEPLEPLHQHYKDLGFDFVDPNPPQRLYCFKLI